MLQALLRCAIAASLLCVGVSSARAQAAPEALNVTPLWSTERFLAGRDALEFALDRRLDSRSERLAILVGMVDVSALVNVRGTRAVYRPASVRLPSGRSEVVAYLVTAGGAWQVLGRFPLDVRTRVGLDEGAIVPSADLSSNGQLDRSEGPAGAADDPRTYQDLTMRLGLEGTFTRDGWQVTTQGNALGVTKETQRLRWGELQGDAPAVDLSDYRVQLARGPVQLALGNLAVGSHRYLVNSFASRGVSSGIRLGRVAAIEAGVVNGTGVVGWSNPLGLGRPAHRMSSLALSLEMLPNRPGAVHVDVSGFDGSVLPIASFNQGAVTDAEESRGLGVQVAVSDASQRVRFAGGFSRSRFDNPGDPLLAGDAVIVAVRPTTRSARYGELAFQVLRGIALTPSLPASLAVAARHERVDPLYRSVGTYVHADVESNGIELTGSLGPFSFQGALSGARDNLDGIASILTTRTRSRAIHTAVPLGALVGSADAWYWPSVNASWQRVHQFGDGIPENGGFDASHVPDQSSTNRVASVVWSHGVWSLTYGWNRSDQDNRQTGRENADFRATGQAVSLGLMPGARFSSSIDASMERQEHLETATTLRLERLGGSSQLHFARHTALSGAFSRSWSRDPFAEQRTRNTEYHLELSQGFTVYGRHDSGTQGRLFIRYARTGAALRPLEPGPFSPPRITWVLTAGASFRLY